MGNKDTGITSNNIWVTPDQFVYGEDDLDGSEIIDFDDNSEFDTNQRWNHTKSTNDELHTYLSGVTALLESGSAYSQEEIKNAMKKPYEDIFKELSRADRDGYLYGEDVTSDSRIKDAFNFLEEEGVFLYMGGDTYMINDGLRETPWDFKDMDTSKGTNRHAESEFGNYYNQLEDYYGVINI